MTKDSKSAISDLRVVGTSFAVSVSDVLLNLFVSLLTGSTVVLSQSLQGLSDLATAGILLVGVRRSRRKPDDTHHFGYGREVFFYVLVAGIFMFIGTGALSVYFGVRQIIDPQIIEHTWVALAMLTFGFLTNGYAFGLSARRLRVSWRSRTQLTRAIRSSMVETKATFVIDLLGTLAAVFGLVALSVYVITGNEFFDGIGSVFVGLLMMTGASLLMADAKELIVGRSVSKEAVAKLSGAITSHEDVHEVLDLRTMYIGSGSMLVIAEVHFRDGLSTDQIEHISDELKTRVKEVNPIVDRVQIEAETPEHELR